MDESGKIALLVGATGLVGGELLTRLLHSPLYKKVVALTRKPLEIRNSKLTEVLFDFDRPDATAIVADDIFCCLGTTIKKAGSRDAFRKVDLDYPVKIGKLAKLNGASQYLIVTAMGADSNSGIFYNRVKGEVEEELKKIEFETLHILRPSLLLGNRNEVRTGEKVGEVLAAVFKPLMIGPLKKYRAIDASKVASALLSYARRKEKGIFTHNSDELQNF